ncbi:MAG: flagellar biosynthetic protein FliQ [Kineosporiaceae bacterium]
MDDTVIQIVATALITASKVAGPVLLTTLAVGLVLSVVQSATQIQESTLTFLPKLAAAAVVLVLTGAWSLRVLTGFTEEIFALVPTLLNS